MKAWLATLALVPMLGACGGEEAKNTAQQATALTAGQWEVTAETVSTEITEAGGEPVIATKAGERTVQQVCVGTEERVPAALFANTGEQCEFADYWVRNGRINNTVRCTREGSEGTISHIAEGTFQAESFEARRATTTAMAGPGDVRIESRLTGRRTGACPAQPAAPQAG